MMMPTRQRRQDHRNLLKPKNHQAEQVVEDDNSDNSEPEIDMMMPTRQRRQDHRNLLKPIERIPDQDKQ